VDRQARVFAVFFAFFPSQQNLSNICAAVKVQSSARAVKHTTCQLCIVEWENGARSPPAAKRGLYSGAEKCCEDILFPALCARFATPRQKRAQM
jgi:hypothetical protein